VAELVAAVAASHAPLITAAPETAEAGQRERVYAAMAALRGELERARPDVLIVCSNEHFTNFFLDNFPPFCIGLGDRHAGPAEAWLRIPRGTLPGHPALGRWLVERALAEDFDPAFSEELTLDHGIMTVLHFLNPDGRVPVVPIVQNCAVAPMPSLGRAAIACIGPITAQTAREVGLPVDVMAREYTMDGLVASLADYFSHPELQLKENRWIPSRSLI